MVRSLRVLAAVALSVLALAWTTPTAAAEMDPHGDAIKDQVRVETRDQVRVETKDRRRADIKVTDAGFEPRQVHAKVGEQITLAFTRTSDRTCMTAIDIPDEDVKQLELPLNRTVTVTITPRKKGTERFHCSAMGMGNGRIVVE